MSQKTLSRYLQGVTIMLFLLITLLYVVGIPEIIQFLLKKNAIAYTNGILPWKILIALTSIPVYISLYHFGRVTIEIGKDNSFSKENAIHLKRISQLCCLDACYFCIGNLLFYFLKFSGILMLCSSMFVVFMTICLSVLAAVLSHLIYKAAKMQEEQDLTI